MKVFVLGLDGATWDVLGPLERDGLLPNLSALKKRGAHGTMRSVFPPLSPVAWTTIMTGKDPGKHGVFEFVEHRHDPLRGHVNSSRAIRSELVWETAGRFGLKAVAGAVPMSYPLRPAPGTYLGDFLSPPNAPDFASDPALFAELQREVGPYQPWNTAIHDGGREQSCLRELTEFLELHLRSVEFLAKRCEWDLFLYNLMAVDRIQHELWHAWEPAHREAKGRDLEDVREGFIEFFRTLDRGIGRIEALLPDDATLVLVSDHGFGPIEYYVNFNVWLLQEGFLTLDDSLYVKQKHWFYRRGVTPEWFYKLMVKLGGARQRVSRFQGKQSNWLDRLGETMFLSRRHIDWSQTQAYSQGNFGQIFLNVKGRQPNGCVDPADVPAVKRKLKERLQAIPHPETGQPLVEKVLDRDELYQGPHIDLAPDLTVVLSDWRYRTIGLHDFTTHKVISPAFGPTGDHRPEGVLIAAGPGIRAGSAPADAHLRDLTPTLLRLLGIPAPGDCDGRVLSELLDPAQLPELQSSSGIPPAMAYSATGPAEDEDTIKQRLADLGYL